MGSTFWIIMIASLAFTAVIIVISMRWVAGLMGSTKANQALLATGADAQATILGLQQTGTFVNNNPQVILTLQVEPPGQAPFQAQTSTILPLVAVPQVQPGNVVAVKYDPADPSKVALNFGA
jgi:hypothetical protein